MHALNNFVSAGLKAAILLETRLFCSPCHRCLSFSLHLGCSFAGLRRRVRLLHLLVLLLLQLLLLPLSLLLNPPRPTREALGIVNRLARLLPSSPEFQHLFSDSQKAILGFFLSFIPPLPPWRVAFPGLAAFLSPCLPCGPAIRSARLGQSALQVCCRSAGVLSQCTAPRQFFSPFFSFFFLLSHQKKCDYQKRRKNASILANGRRWRPSRDRCVPRPYKHHMRQMPFPFSVFEFHFSSLRCYASRGSCSTACLLDIAGKRRPPRLLTQPPRLLTGFSLAQARPRTALALSQASLCVLSVSLFRFLTLALAFSFALA